MELLKTPDLVSLQLPALQYLQAPANDSHLAISLAVTEQRLRGSPGGPQQRSARLSKWRTGLGACD